MNLRNELQGAHSFEFVNAAIIFGVVYIANGYYS